MREYFDKFITQYLWRANFDKQRQRAMNVFIALAIIANVILFVLNLSGVYLAPLGNSAFYRIGSIFILAILFSLFWFNRKGYNRWVGLALLLILVIKITFILPLDVLNRTFILYGLFAFIASFIIMPAFSYVLAAFSAILYTAAFFIYSQTSGFNFLSLIALLVISFFAHQIGLRLHIAMNEAGINETKYYALANNNPAFVYVVENGHTGRWTYANPQIQQLVGYTPEEWCSSPNLWESLIYPEDKEQVLAEEQRCAQSESPFQAEYRLTTRDGETVWVRDEAVFVPNPKGILLYQGVMLNISIRKRATEIREASYEISQSAYAADNLTNLYVRIHQILGSLIQAENFFIALYDDAKDIITFPYFVDEFDDAPPQHPIGNGLTDYVLRTGEPIFASPQVYKQLEKLGHIASLGTPSIDWLGVPLKVKDHTIGAMVVQSYHEGDRYNEETLNILNFVSTQVANAIERKRAEETIQLALEEKEVLVREIHHRVKNNLQVILGLLDLQANSINDPHTLEMLQETRSRITSIALVHQELYQSDDLARVNLAEYFQLLVDNLIRVYNTPEIQLTLSVEDIFLGVDKAIPCGLILNELISNAMKYAFPGNKSGKVEVTLRQSTGRKDEAEYVLSVDDDGIGLPEEINTSAPDTLGLQIVNILTRQLKGTTVIDVHNGTRFEIRFPV